MEQTPPQKVIKQNPSEIAVSSFERILPSKDRKLPLNFSDSVEPHPPKKSKHEAFPPKQTQASFADLNCLPKEQKVLTVTAPILQGRDKKDKPLFF